MELLRQVLADKKKEISDTQDRLRQVKDEAIHEYHDSNTLLAELERSFAELTTASVKSKFLIWTWTYLM